MTHVDQPFRLPSGGQVDRNRPLTFRFDGRLLHGFDGDTLASALLANGVRLVGRSLKFHRPRGILSAGVEEPNALMRIGEGAYAEPNVRATLQPLYEGLIATSQNCWPSLRHDFGAFFDLTSGLWPAGFYNKTFMWPNWHWYEGAIRRAAGLGRLPEGQDPDRYVHQNAHCDILICGGGPAGLAAALTAAHSRARVILVEQGQELGGSLLECGAEIDAKRNGDWLLEARARLNELDNVRILRNTMLSGFFDHNSLLATERLHSSHGPISGPRERLWILRAREVVLATGAIEQPLLFPNNDRPGVMLATAVAHYARRYAVAAGHQVVVATNNDSAYAATRRLFDAGVKVVALLDSRQQPDPSLLRQMWDRKIDVYQSCIPVDTSGRQGIRHVTVAKHDTASPRERIVARLPCDCLAMAGGWQPTVHLFSQARGTLRYDPDLGAFYPGKAPAHVQLAGAVNGAFDVNQAIDEGHRAGLAAANAVGLRSNPYNMAPISGAHAYPVRPERVTVERNPHCQWVDFQHDVTLRDVDIAVRENYVSVEHLKRYTTTGMSVDQGKTSNLNALIALAERTKRHPSQVGTTTFRPFYMPVTLGTIAGRRRGQFYALVRKSPLAAASASLGAVFQDYGSWRRPAAYPRRHETLTEGVQREARTVREAVGMFDGSPLGKIEVKGPDAAEFLNRIYVNKVLSLKVGQARYGIMLNDNGVILDDSVFIRIADEHFLLHPSSGHADRIYAWLEEWLQGEWPTLEVLLTPVTSQWATVALAGPRARDVLMNLARSLVLSDNEFPHMHWRTTELNGIPVRILRASFAGELGFELSVPADYGEAVWRGLLGAGDSFGITPFGVESLMVLRTEKGYLHVGSDTDGTTTLDDISWSDVVRRKPEDFIGKRSLQRPHNRRTDRLQFVGLEPLSPNQPITAGAHVVGPDVHRAPAPTQGYVTSACFSPNLKRWIALGLVRQGRARIGESVNLFHADRVTPARIVNPTFYDPDGARLHG